MFVFGASLPLIVRPGNAQNCPTADLAGASYQRLVMQVIIRWSSPEWFGQRDPQLTINGGLPAAKRRVVATAYRANATTGQRCGSAPRTGAMAHHRARAASPAPCLLATDRR